MNHFKKNVHVLLVMGVALLGGLSRAGASACQSCAYITGINTLNVWDTSNNTVTTVVTAGSNLDSLLFDSNGNIIFDGSVTPGQLYTYTFATNTVAPFLSLGSVTNDLALEPTPGTLLVTSKGDKKIYRINLATKAFSVLYSGLQPDGIIYDNNGHLFACLNGNQVSQLDPTTGAVIKTITGINAADGLTFNSTTGKLYAASDDRTGNGGFYTIPTDLSAATFTNLGKDIDGVGTTGNFLYLVVRGVGGLQYNLTTHAILVSPTITGADDIAPLSGLGSQGGAVTLTALNPSFTTAGGPSFTLTATGTGFVNDSALMWNGSARTTTLVSGTQLTATINAADISAAGTASVTVVNPAEGQTSNALTFTINSNGTSGNAPVINFTANPTTIFKGGSSTLSWSITNATSAVIDQGIGAVSSTSGSQSVSPTQSVIYTMTAWGNGSVTKAQVTITVNAPPVLTSLVVVPAAAAVRPGDTISFTVLGYDQNGNSINVPNVIWSVASPNGSSINSASGMYTAGATANGSADTVTAKSGSLTGTATVLIQDKVPGQFEINSVTATPNPVTGNTTTLTINATDTTNGQLSYDWTFSGPAGVTISNPNSAQTKATFFAPGTYVFTADAFSNNFPGVKLTASVTVQVIQTIFRVVITPPSASIFANGTQPFQAQVRDQFDAVMPGETVDWSVPLGVGQLSIQTASLSNTFASTPDLINRTITIVATTNDPNQPVKQGTAQVTIIPVGASGSYDISNAHAYPVPWKSTGNIPYITFTGLAPATDVYIYTTNARLVRHLSTVNSEDLHWFVDNDGGERVGSSVYLYKITNSNSGQKIKGKVVVIQ